MANNIFLILGPSGSGKTSIVSEALKRDDKLSKPITYTTRPMRDGEQDGKDYFFLPIEEFDKASFTEVSEYHGNWYGSKADNLWNDLYQGKDIIMILDINGVYSYLDWANNAPNIEPHVIFIKATNAIGQILERSNKTGETAIQILERISQVQIELALSDNAIIDMVIENNPGEMDDAVEKLLEFISLHRA
jgi:guanylate kinase